jgi:hypothetical protein
MVSLNNIKEDLMPTFMMSLNWTDQGIRAVKESPKRSEHARELCAPALFAHGRQMNIGSSFPSSLKRLRVS